uniref:Truncated envelope glycoprotein n=1 Tax=Human immunodeficiency virus type 1 TaxID=11676 RepID=A0A0H3YCS1_HV1|nr:truncated envelope glycoprotein [Human immunodeficiency virus 1]
MRVKGTRRNCPQWWI